MVLALKDLQSTQRLNHASPFFYINEIRCPYGKAIGTMQLYSKRSVSNFFSTFDSVSLKQHHFQQARILAGSIKGIVSGILLLVIKYIGGSKKFGKFFSSQCNIHLEICIFYIIVIPCAAQWMNIYILLFNYSNRIVEISLFYFNDLVNFAIGKIDINANSIDTDILFTARPLSLTIGKIHGWCLIVICTVQIFQSTKYLILLIHGIPNTTSKCMLNTLYFTTTI